ncbi:MAG TPA: LEA type 2 family protein [Kofleriaceae bacterium]|nr:LEA type 2 family protein [Kofleriaceae bacterium]
MRPRPALLALAALALLASACSFFTRSIEKPTADVRAVSLSTLSLSSVEGELRLDVANPNGFGVPLSSLQWELSIGGARAVTGAVELSQTIPARGTAPVVTTLRIDPRDAAAVAAQVARGSRGYKLGARLTFTTPVGAIAVDVVHEGTLAGAGGVLGSLR